MDGPDSYEISGPWPGTASLCLWSSVLDEGFPPDTPVPTPHSEVAQLGSFCFVLRFTAEGTQGGGRQGLRVLTVVLSSLQQEWFVFVIAIHFFSVTEAPRIEMGW